MGESSNEIRTILKEQKEIMTNLLNLIELEKEKSAILRSLLPEGIELEHQEKIESVQKSINETYLKTRKLMENIKDNY